MIFDKENLFSDHQAVTATAASDNVINLGVSRDIGKGVPVPIDIRVTEDFATLTDLTVSVEVDDNESFSSATTLATTAAIAAADLVVGKVFSIQYMPLGIEQYVRLKYTVGGSNATAGKIHAGIVASHQQGH